MAHKLARILWHLLKHGVPYDPKAWAAAEGKSKNSNACTKMPPPSATNSAPPQPLSRLVSQEAAGWLILFWSLYVSFAPIGFQPNGLTNRGTRARITPLPKTKPLQHGAPSLAEDLSCVLSFQKIVSWPNCLLMI